jgi:hypothetical protein
MELTKIVVLKHKGTTNMAFTEVQGGLFDYGGMVVPESIVRELAMEDVPEAQETLEQIDEKLASSIGHLALSA